MSYSVPGSYNGWESYAGQAFAVKADDSTTLLSGTIDASGCGVLSLPLPDDYIGGIHWFVNGVKRKVGSFDYRDIPDQAGGSGPLEVMVQTAVSGARVRLKQAGGIGDEAATANSEGHAVFHIAAGLWNVHAAAPGFAAYSSSSPEEIEADTTLEIELVQNVITPPSAPNLATVVFRAIDFGAAAPNIKVRFTPVMRGPFAIDGAYETDHQVEVTTDENGQAEAELYPASVLTANGISPARYSMESKQCGNLRRIIEVPDEGGLAIGMVV